MVSVKLENLTKRFGDNVVVDQVDLQIDDGEFFTLLGPSGCGKTTTLRIVAGFYRPDQGNVYFGKELMNDIPPFKRDTGMVFQTYALWPHMNIRDNVAYGLVVRKIPRKEIEEKVTETLRLVGLEGFERRLPSELSGGQQQRVALARALVIEPKVLLLDEPLSNLDAKLRVQTRVEITRLQRKLGITTVYVTHDQEEALCISDRIAVMNKGRVQQVAQPRAIYEEPGSEFVADFIGVANFLKGTLAKMDAKSKVATVETEDSERFEVTHDGEIAVGSTVLISFRPEVVEMEEDGKVAGAVNQIEGRIRIASYLGDMVRYEVEAKDKIFRVDIHNPAGKKLFAEGENVRLSFSSSSARIVPI
jgi:ABC-type Fe3+/spermidine/putrescine transport system ATPase subunit